MSQITIQCHLIAKEPSRQALWRLIAELNTPLINEILNQIANHSDFETWRENILTRSAISYLLKNGRKISTKPEETEKFAKTRRKVEIKIERLQEKLEVHKPKGRDLTGERWLETLITAVTTAPENEKQVKSWQNILLTKSKSIPFSSLLLNPNSGDINLSLLLQRHQFILTTIN